MKKFTAFTVCTLFVLSLAIPFSAFAGDPMAKTKTSASAKKMDDAADKGKTRGSASTKKTASSSDDSKEDAKKKDKSGKTPQKKSK